MAAALVAAACTQQPARTLPPAAPVAAAAPSPVTTTPPQPADSGASGRGGAAPAPAQPRPYNRVITANSRTRRGMFAVHQLNDRLYFEIPARELGKDQLVVGRYARAAASDPSPTGGGFGTFAGDRFGERTLRWDRTGNRVILRSPSFAVTADTASSVYQAVANSNYASRRTGRTAPP
jgi:hypothetical protein